MAIHALYGVIYVVLPLTLFVNLQPATSKINELNPDKIRRNIEIRHAKASHLKEVISEKIRGRWRRALMEPKANLRTGKNCFITSVFSNMADGKTYFFNNSYFWRLSSSYKADFGYPRNVTQKWKGLPHTFDEVFLWGANWKTYFFKGKYYYLYDTQKDQVLNGYPQLISQGWAGVPNDVDAAFTDRNRISFFFKGKLVYKYDNSRDRVAFGYPMKIRDVFPGLPNDIDSAFHYYYDGSIYFFKGWRYYKWNEIHQKADGPFFVRQDWHNICTD
ncbi:matrix metalloproteinase-21-like [Hydractinia symbiolongicarpus]|uniref:matrix metalloproteinase-21-like n=1 Tax=Hydractinia symbiolongicarpus TaxID=13093 RepID=UPI00254D190E|nr:matrix metalloproteinase-21-like [Hydractinia symbiolongicarpus]